MKQVTLNFNPKHFKMIQRCAKLRNQSVEEWIIRATEYKLRSDMDDFEYINIEVGFGDAEIEEVYEEVFGGAS